MKNYRMKRVGNSNSYCPVFDNADDEVLTVFLYSEVIDFKDRFIKALDDVISGRKEKGGMSGNICDMLINGETTTIQYQFDEVETKPVTMPTVEVRELIDRWLADVDELKKKRMVKMQDAYQIILMDILGGIKVPHSVSEPVIRKVDGKYYLACHVFFYNREDAQTGMAQRPTYWAIADIRTGKIVKTYYTSENEFSDASYDEKYCVRLVGEHDTSKWYHDNAFAILDSVRQKIIETGKFYELEYKVYLDKIIANIPEDYQRFTYDLSV